MAEAHEKKTLAPPLSEGRRCDKAADNPAGVRAEGRAVDNPAGVRAEVKISTAGGDAADEAAAASAAASAAAERERTV